MESVPEMEQKNRSRVLEDHLRRAESRQKECNSRRHERERALKQSQSSLSSVTAPLIFLRKDAMLKEFLNHLILQYLLAQATTICRRDLVGRVLEGIEREVLKRFHACGYLLYGGRGSLFHSLKFQREHYMRINLDDIKDRVAETRQLLSNPDILVVQYMDELVHCWDLDAHIPLVEYSKRVFYNSTHLSDYYIEWCATFLDF